jgi:hypothetical protein
MVARFGTKTLTRLLVLLSLQSAIMVSQWCHAFKASSSRRADHLRLATTRSTRLGCLQHETWYTLNPFFSFALRVLPDNDLVSGEGYSGNSPTGTTIFAQFVHRHASIGSLFIVVRTVGAI